MVVRHRNDDIILLKFLRTGRWSRQLRFPPESRFTADVVHRDSRAAELHDGEYDRQLKSTRADGAGIHDDFAFVATEKWHVRMTADDNRRVFGLSQFGDFRA